MLTTSRAGRAGQLGKEEVSFFHFLKGARWIESFSKNGQSPELYDHFDVIELRMPGL